VKYIPVTEKEKQRMLDFLGIASFEELISNIPHEIRVKGDLKISSPLSEIELVREMKEISAQNMDGKGYSVFLGGGAYDHYVPAIISNLISRSEFLTAYTPYQAEISQGTLQSIYEYQSLICDLTGMDIANASMYDGASALAEAVLMANRLNDRKDVLISSTLNPVYQRVISTYCSGTGISIKHISSPDGTTSAEELKDKVSENACCAVFQYPNFFGIIEDIAMISEIVKNKNEDVLLIFCIDPIAMGILKPPAEFGADIIVGEGQGMGNKMNFGGPYLGFFACKKEYMRQLPGRVVGATVDKKGRRGFTLTLQTREQHIRREKATSNICTNQALNALSSAIYLITMGKKGLREVATQCISKAHYAMEKICGIRGFELLFKKPFFKEFAIKSEKDTQLVLDSMRKTKIIAGPQIGRFSQDFKNSFLIAVTENRTKEEIDALAEGLANV